MTTSAEHPPEQGELPPASQAPVPGGRNPSVADLLRSLVPLTALILLVVWLYSPNEGNPITVVDPTSELAYAATLAGFEVLAAQDLPAGWRPTSAVLSPRDAVGPYTVRVGYVSPQDEFAQVVQTDRDRADLLEDVLGSGVVTVGPVDVGGVAWDGLRTADGETALVRAEAASTVLVTGSAPLDVLRELAAALQPFAP